MTEQSLQNFMHRAMLALALTFGLVACGDNDDPTMVTPTPTPGVNSAPVLIAVPPADLVFSRGTVPPTLNLLNFVTDADGDLLSYQVTNSRQDLVQVTVATNGQLSVQAVDPNGTGRAEIALRVLDTNGGILDLNFAVIVQARGPNIAPRVAQPIDDVLVDLASVSTQIIPLSDAFVDANNDLLTFMVSSSDVSVARVSLDDSGQNAQLEIRGPGRTRVRVSATDIDGGTVTDIFDVVNYRVQAGQLTPLAPAIIEIAPGARARPLALGSLFRNVSGDTSNLVYTGSSNKPDLISVVIDRAGNAFLSATGNALDGSGNPAVEQTAFITISARDVDGATGVMQFSVRITENAPRALCQPRQNSAQRVPFGLQQLLPLQCADFPNENDGLGTVLTLQPVPGNSASEFLPDEEGTVFSDPPAEGALSFIVDSTNPRVAVPEFNPLTNAFSVRLTGAAGTASISIVAVDQEGYTAHVFFTVTQGNQQTVPVLFQGLPTINTERRSEQTFRVRLADFVSDANENDGDADDSPLSATPCPTGAVFPSYQYRVAVNPDTGVVNATAVLPVPGDVLRTNSNLGEFDLRIQPVVGSTALTFEVRDCDGDFTRANLQVNINAPSNDLFVARSSATSPERTVLRFPSTATGSAIPTAIYDFDTQGGFALDETGAMTQVGLIPDSLGVANRVPAIQTIHNALNRGPRASADVAGGVTNAGDPPVVRWNDAFDRRIDTSLPANVRPRNVLFEQSSGLYLVSSTRNLQPSANFEAIRVYAAAAGENASPVYRVQTRDLHSVGATQFASVWDLAYVEQADHLYVSLLNGTVVRCESFLGNLNAQPQRGPDCQFDSDNSPTTPDVARVLRPQVSCINRDINSSGAACQRDLRGIAYISTTDTLVVTDVGPATEATSNQAFPAPDVPSFDQDGSIYVFHQVSLTDLSVNAGFVLPNLTIRNTGDYSQNATRLGNPMDVVIEGDDIIVAEAANPGRTAPVTQGTRGAVLRFAGQASSGISLATPMERAPDAILEVIEPIALALNRVPDPLQDLSDLDTSADQPGVIARRNETDRVLLSTSTAGPNATAVVQQYNLNYDVETGLPLQPSLGSIGRTPTLNYNPSPMAGLDITAASEVLGSVVNGPQSNQPGGLVHFELRSSRSPLSFNDSRLIQSGPNEEEADLVNPKGLDFVQELGLVMVTDIRGGGGPAGAIQVYAYGAEGDLAPVFGTLLNNRPPWDLDYDPDADRLFVATTDGSVLIFDNYVAGFTNNDPARHLDATRARVIVPATNGNRASINLHGIVHHRVRDAAGNFSHEELLLSDVGTVAVPGANTDGQVFVMRLSDPANARGLINVDLRITNIRDGVDGRSLAQCDAGMDFSLNPAVPNGTAGDALLGNPVDIAYDPLRDVAFVAEKANALLLQFKLLRNATTNRAVGFELSCINVVNDPVAPTALLAPEAVQIRPSFLP